MGEIDAGEFDRRFDEGEGTWERPRTLSADEIRSLTTEEFDKYFDDGGDMSALLEEVLAERLKGKP